MGRSRFYHIKKEKIIISSLVGDTSSGSNVDSWTCGAVFFPLDFVSFR